MNRRQMSAIDGDSRLSLPGATLAAARMPEGASRRRAVHGIGYLPIYIAIANGYFAEHGIEVKIVTVETGAGHTKAVLSGQAFAFIGGPEHNAFAKIERRRAARCRATGRSRQRLYSTP